MSKLQEYNKKRNFNKTKEPVGKSGKRTKKLRFCIQHHIARKDHYDLRLEWDGVLKSWAVPKGPSYNDKDKRLAIMVEDHPIDYRNFEGIIPKGEYGGGTVMLWDKGYWEPIEGYKPNFKEGPIKFILKGSRLKGMWTLVKLKNDNTSWAKKRAGMLRRLPSLSSFFPNAARRRSASSCVSPPSVLLRVFKASCLGRA